ncbi:LPXTG cell wall anchor domain-containing protein [Streptococcus ruminantium]|uniref:LPXTG cell wall anchor domain-containing protein n=1 Tax=Streptococcus ruminantium TaxID=1917441 RepID=UPI0012DBE253|nr:LPXTG cell wall anchor domain-containing protein [Streptococcus ruminantium]
MLKKQTILSMVTVSTMILNGAVVLADETTPVDSSAPVEISQPTLPTEPNSTEEVVPVEPSQPVEPSPPSDQSNTPKEEPSVPIDPTLPSPDLKPEEKEEVKPSQPVEPTPPSDQPALPKEEPSKPESPQSPKTAEEAINQGESQVGTISTETKQTVEEVTPTKPVVTNTGYTIISTDNSQPVVRYTDGTTAKVAAESIGAVVNKDKTISVKTSDGQMKTLPNTGEAQSLLTLLGGLLLGAIWFIRRKQI